MTTLTELDAKFSLPEYLASNEGLGGACVWSRHFRSAREPEKTVAEPGIAEHN